MSASAGGAVHGTSESFYGGQLTIALRVSIKAFCGTPFVLASSPELGPDGAFVGIETAKVCLNWLRRGPGLRVCSEIRVTSASSYSFAPMADLQG